MRRRRVAQAGFTLIELMITLVLFSIAIAGVLAVAVSMTNGFREQRGVIFAEGAARGAMDFLSDAVRQASPGVLTGAITAIDIPGCPVGTFTTVNNQGSPGAPDRLKLVFAYGSVATTATTAYIGGSTTLTVINAEQLAVGDHIVISNSAVGAIVEITGKAGNTLTLAPQQCVPPGVLNPGAAVVRALRAELYIQDLDGQPALWMDPDSEGPQTAEPLAEGIEDFQVAVGLDTNGDGQLVENGVAADDDEWIYNYPGDAVPVGTLRAIRITLVARSPKAVNGIGTFLRPAAEDRLVAGATDGYRRRTLKSSIEIRNLGGSP
jgi:prepilin-type N-terminal cleavage/methylation domain-containing protein